MYMPPYPDHSNQPPYQPPYSNYHPYYGYPPPPPQRVGVRGWAVALIAIATFLLGIIGGCATGFSMGLTTKTGASNFGNSIDDSFSSSDDSKTYGFQEPVSTSGTAYDLSFNVCDFQANVTLTSYLRGDEAKQVVTEQGGDPDVVPAGKEFAVATFQVALTDASTDSSVIFNPQDFRFDISESSDDLTTGNYPKGSPALENLVLQKGQSGQITVYAVVDENLKKPHLLFYADKNVTYEFSTNS